MDGEISPGGAALDMATLGGTGEAEVRVLQGLTGEPPPYKSKPCEASPARRVSQHTTKISSLKITAGWARPRRHYTGVDVAATRIWWRWWGWRKWR
jgi:hypothetical protein